MTRAKSGPIPTLDMHDVRLVQASAAERDAIKWRIKQLRRDYDELRPGKLAEKFEVSRSTIERAERGIYE